jgi:Squalene-hopene cyclase C-terminal domain/Prenyltransferase and squalene oxidase repeat
VSWELASFLILGVVLLGGFAWYERSRPTSQVVALVAALAALAIAGRIAFAAFPNVKPTTDIVILAGYALGPAPGFAVGALTALVSNFWFGQGPWTPWQMAGWGLCGVLGAGLAVVRPRAGRVTLAAVCALAGIAYGALLNFSLMATYGGDLSLQRFLALESRAIPFDAAHAIGNATLAFVAGPAMVRMLARFRRRFEWRTPAMASAVLVVLALVTVLPASAQASDASRAASWLVAAQNADGGWGSSPEDESAPDMTGWAMLGLEAAGRNPLDVSSGGRNPVGYLRAQVEELDSPGDLARTILALHGAGVNPRDFAGHDLVEELAGHRRNNGSFEGWPNSTAFAVMALRVGGGGVAQSTAWLAKAQNADGGWGDEPDLPSNADSTAAVMQAMPETTAARDGLAYLRKAQRPNGGFPLGGNGSVNSQSTAWALQGMLALGKDSGGALDYLAARQDADGHYRASATSDATPVWVTAQVIPAVTGNPFPISPVARAPKPASLSPGAEGGTPPIAPAVPLTPPAAGTESTPGLSESFGQGGVPPASGGSPSTGAPGAGAGAVPTLPGATPEGDEAETTPSQAPAPPFEASENPGPKPLAPVGIGLASGGLALGGVLFFGRRFSW